MGGPDRRPPRSSDVYYPMQASPKTGEMFVSVVKALRVDVKPVWVDIWFLLQAH